MMVVEVGFVWSGEVLIGEDGDIADVEEVNG